MNKKYKFHFIFWSNTLPPSKQLSAILYFFYKYFKMIFFTEYQQQTSRNILCFDDGFTELLGQFERPLFVIPDDELINVLVLCPNDSCLACFYKYFNHIQLGTKMSWKLTIFLSYIYSVIQKYMSHYSEKEHSHQYAGQTQPSQT